MLESISDAGLVNIILIEYLNLPNLDLETTDLALSSVLSCHNYHELFLHSNLTHVLNFITHRLSNRLDLILTTNHGTNVPP